MKKSLASLLMAILIGSSAYSTIIYTDVTPDLVTTPSSTAFFDVDMDNNSTPDFRFTCVDLSGLRFIIAQAGAVGLGNFVLDDTVGGKHDALALAANIVIGPSSSVWHSMASTNPTLLSDFFGTYTGLWLNSLDYYLGVQFQIGANTHFGWIRMNINQTTSVVSLKDYAYEDVANTAILAGAMPGADVATNLVAADISDNSNGNDLQLSFDMAANESTVLSYRAIVVKNGTPPLTLADAQAVNASKYKAIVPNGSNQTVVIGAVFDYDGDPIIIGQEYRIYLLSMAGAGVLADGLSLSSNVVVLNTVADVAISISGTDNANQMNGSDILLNFTRAATESGLSTYRVIVMKSADAATYTLSDAQAVVSGRYQDFIPNGSNVQSVMNASLLDKDGDNIQNNVAYKIRILSIADGSLANVDSLSASSSEFTLTNTPTGLEDATLTGRGIFASGNSVVVDLPHANSKAQIDLYNLNGQLVLSRTVSGQRNFIRSTSGCYIAVLTDNEVVLKQKLMISEF